tara:strand:+ start:1873 stop:2727 length:855 start_codon:yes stop_codon:yes gene_type:complete
MAIPYLNGYTIKPASVNALGIVTFTDGTNDVTPNQQQCEAYGYTYNEILGTCTSFNYNTNLDRSFNNIDNVNKGTGNTTERGTNNTYIIGENNTVKGLSRNNIIIGTDNEISNGVNNTFVYGNKANSIADNSIVLGGNNSTDILGKRQNTTIIYGGITEDASATDAYLNNVTGSYYKPASVANNSILYFQSETIAVRVGGISAGSTGDYKAWVERGVIKNARTTLSIDMSKTAISSSGTTTGWDFESQVSGTDYKQSLTGAANTEIEWVSTIRITEIRTSVDLT